MTYLLDTDLDKARLKAADQCLEEQAIEENEQLAAVVDEAMADVMAGKADWQRLTQDPTYMGAFVKFLMDLAQPEIGRRRVRSHFTYGCVDGCDEYF